MRDVVSRRNKAKSFFMSSLNHFKLAGAILQIIGQARSWGGSQQSVNARRSKVRVDQEYAASLADEPMHGPDWPRQGSCLPPESRWKPKSYAMAGFRAFYKGASAKFEIAQFPDEMDWNCRTQEDWDQVSTGPGAICPYFLKLQNLGKWLPPLDCGTIAGWARRAEIMGAEPRFQSHCSRQCARPALQPFGQSGWPLFLLRPLECFVNPAHDSLSFQTTKPLFTQSMPWLLLSLVGSENGRRRSSFARIFRDDRDHRKNRQAQDKLDVTFGPHRSVLHFQQKSKTESQSQAGAETPTGKYRQFREGGSVRQVGRVQNQELLAFLAFHQPLATSD